MTPRSVMDFMVNTLMRVVTEVAGAAEQAPVASPAECAFCGSRIRAEWRLCPHCGELRKEPSSEG